MPRRKRDTDPVKGEDGARSFKYRLHANVPPPRVGRKHFRRNRCVGITRVIGKQVANFGRLLGKGSSEHPI